MKNKKVLFVSSELIPYLSETELATTASNIIKNAHLKGMQTRIFMPKFGLINERRHQLHEVIRLSGINLIINDLDIPLIMKVASIPKERIQVYFIDNDDYFKRKSMFTDEKGDLFLDNDERAIFFAKGVIEAVKKLNWSPDIIHIHGWIASLLPIYLRETYKNEPLFRESKIVTSLYDNSFKGTLNNDLINKIGFDKISEEKLEIIRTPNHQNVLKIAVEYSDAVVSGSKNISDELYSFIKEKDIPFLEYQADSTNERYISFYSNLISTD